MEQKKLTAREKVGVYALIFLIRWMVPTKDMDDKMQKLVEDIGHEIRCNL
jgi:hypothetical protein